MLLHINIFFDTSGLLLYAIYNPILRVINSYNYAILGTLAAASDKLGLFEKARLTAQKVFELDDAASQSQMTEDFRKRLELYSAGLPFSSRQWD